VVVAVVAMREMQVAIDQVIHMVAVRDHLMPTAGSVDVVGVVAGAAMGRGTDGGIGFADRNHMLIDMVAVGEVQVAIVQIIDVAIVTNGGMAAIWTVLVGMIGMLVASGHEVSPVSVKCGGGDAIRRRSQTDSAA